MSAHFVWRTAAGVRTALFYLPIENGMLGAMLGVRNVNEIHMQIRCAHALGNAPMENFHGKKPPQGGTIACRWSKCGTETQFVKLCGEAPTPRKF
jgi:hypothetical protein